MGRIVAVILIGAFIAVLFCGLASADSRRTWANIGKGLAIYEGAKVVTGRQGNIVDDVTGGMQPRQPQVQSGGGTYQDAYNAGYKEGYEAGYNAGFKNGVQQANR